MDGGDWQHCDCSSQAPGGLIAVTRDVEEGQVCIERLLGDLFGVLLPFLNAPAHWLSPCSAANRDCSKAPSVA